jgi:glycosyltransferase involved in cell wall biosynthesis
MRILHLISSNGLFGAERVVIELSKSLRERDCQPVVGVLRNSHNPHVEVADEARAQGIEYVIFPCRRQLDPSPVRAIRRYIRQTGVDLVHCHGYKSNLYGLLASRALVPAVTTNHNWLRSDWRLKVYCFLDSLWIRFFHRVIAVSADIRDAMRKYGVPEEKIRIVDNGIDMYRFRNKHSIENLKSAFGLNGDFRFIGTVGSLGHEKGHSYLLRAAKGILDSGTPVKFLIVGDGKLRESLEAEAARLGITDSVIFTGYRVDIPELLSLMDIFVLPSIKEGLPMVVLEAMASARPVIATRVGAVPRIVRDGENGVLVEPGDVDGLVRGMARLLEDKAGALKIARAGYETVIRDFSSEKMCVKYLTIYREVLSGQLSLQLQ